MGTSSLNRIAAVSTYLIGPANVRLYGAPFNWSLAPLQVAGDEINAPGLMKHLAQAALEADLLPYSYIWAPNPSAFNAKVVDATDKTFPEVVGNDYIHIRRGVDADGVVVPHGHSGMIASADCPTIVVTNKSVGVIMAHAGRDSLIDRVALQEIREPRHHFSVVDAIAERIPPNVRGQTEVFITCGIGADHFAHPVGGTNESGESVVNLHNVTLRDYLIGLGKDCLYGDPDQVKISLPHVIQAQFHRHGITDVSWDSIDTYGDREEIGRYHRYPWHSSRRGRNPGEKQYRNLVLVTHH
ncbi:MAG: hypothetical protein WD049_00920 [Candidatus Paceibacterota bacterium]